MLKGLVLQLSEPKDAACFEKACQATLGVLEVGGPVEMSREACA